MHARNYFENKIFWKKITKNPYKSQLYFFFRKKSLLMYKIIKNKKGLELVTRRSSGYEKSSENFVISYILSDQVYWCNIKQLLSYFKNYICKFMQANSWHKLFHFHLSFCIWKVWKGSEKITKNWISRERKELFRWNKKNFRSFWKGIIWWKNNNLIKNSRHKL